MEAPRAPALRHPVVVRAGCDARGVGRVEVVA